MSDIELSIDTITSQFDSNTILTSLNQNLNLTDLPHFSNYLDINQYDLDCLTCLVA